MLKKDKKSIRPIKLKVEILNFFKRVRKIEQIKNTQIK